MSTRFPDADAAVPTQLFSVQGIGGNGIAVSATEIFLNNQRNIHRLSHAGALRETIDHGYVSFPGPLDYFNGQLIYGSRQTSGGSLSLPSLVRMYYHSTIGITKTAKGYLRRQNSGVFLHLFANPRSGVTVDAYSRSSSTKIASQGDLIYGSGPWTLSALTDDNELRLIRILNIQQNASDIATYRDRLFILSGRTVYTLDIRKYRPLARNTKTTIYPMFANEGDTIDLKQFSPDAERSCLMWVTINSRNSPLTAAINSSWGQVRKRVCETQSDQQNRRDRDRQFRVLSDCPSGSCARLAKRIGIDNASRKQLRPVPVGPRCRRHIVSERSDSVGRVFRVQWCFHNRDSRRRIALHSTERGAKCAYCHHDRYRSGNGI